MGKSFQPTATLETLRARAQLIDEARLFFRERGYWEVDTPLLARECVVDAWIEPFATRWSTNATTWDDPASGDLAVLQTSPEWGMKRLLAAGSGSIFQLCKSFRNGELGDHHNPEFLMLEWYAVDHDLADELATTEALVRRLAAQVPQPPEWSTAPFERLPYDEAFERFLGRRVLTMTAAELANLAREVGCHPPASLATGGTDDWLNYLLAERIEPHLGKGHPTFLLDYPATQAALAKTRWGDRAGARVADRFELYVEGVELCNGYDELADADELERRHLELSNLRHENGLRPLPAPRHLWEAVRAGLPQCTGVAVGFDRLCQVLLRCPQLKDVVAFGWEAC